MQQDNDNNKTAISSENLRSPLLLQPPSKLHALALQVQYNIHKTHNDVPACRQPLCPFITSTSCLSTTTITNRSGTLAKFPVQIRYLSPLLIVNHEETCLKYSNIAILLHPGNSFALQSSSTIYFLVDTTNQ